MIDGNLGMAVQCYHNGHEGKCNAYALVTATNAEEPLLDWLAGQDNFMTADEHKASFRPFRNIHVFFFRRAL